MNTQTTTVRKNHLRMANFLAYLTITVMFTTLCVGVFWLFWPTDVLEVYSIELLQPSVKQGCGIRYIIHYDKYQDEPGEVTKMLIGEDNNRAYSLVAHFMGALPAGRALSAETFTAIPPFVKPGRYRLHYHIKYTLNPLRNFLEEFETPAFEVTQGDRKSSDCFWSPYGN